MPSGPSTELHVPQAGAGPWRPWDRVSFVSMFLFKLITSEEFLHLETEAHVCASLSLWLSEFSKGKVLNLKGVSQNDWEFQEELQDSETPQGPLNYPEDLQNLSNIPRILVTSQEPQNTNITPMNPQNFTNTPEHLKQLRTCHIPSTPKV